MTDDAKKVSLLPCPFCGGEAVAVIGLRQHKGHGVRCGVAKCYASIGCHGETEAEAIAAWNTRQPQTDALEVEIGRLTDLLRRVVNLAEAYATGTGEAFNNTIAEARATLKESK
jgi:Lar family restriction alleviation protein